MPTELDKSPSNEVKEIMNNCVAKNTRHGYNMANIRFMLWLYNDSLRMKLLSPWFLKKIKEAKKTYEGKEFVSKFRQIAHNSLEGTSCQKNFPVLLHKMEFNVISEFIVSQKKM